MPAAAGHGRRGRRQDPGPGGPPPCLPAGSSASSSRRRRASPLIVADVSGGLVAADPAEDVADPERLVPRRSRPSSVSVVVAGGLVACDGDVRRLDVAGARPLPPVPAPASRPRVLLGPCHVMSSEFLFPARARGSSVLSAPLRRSSSKLLRYRHKDLTPPGLAGLARPGLAWPGDCLPSPGAAWPRTDEDVRPFSRRSS